MSATASLDAWEWFGHHTHHHGQFGDAPDLLRMKEAQGRTISVCLPTRDEAETIGPIVRCIREELMERVPLVDELAVMDSASADGTVETAAQEGATVYQDAEILPELPHLGGKGDALWKSLFVLGGDVIAFVDADIRNFSSRFVTGLLGPLLSDPAIRYTKAFYERPLDSGDGALSPTGGGRVTELLVRPFLNLFFPPLAAVVQPLSGEYAGTREALESVPFFTGYGVELGLLLDISERFGLDALAQVDVEERVHRNRSMPELSRMAFGIMQAAVERLGSLGRVELRSELSRQFVQFSNQPGEYHIEVSAIEVHERPPAISVPGYRGAARALP